jgi:hypothetical protein
MASKKPKPIVEQPTIVKPNNESETLKTMTNNNNATPTANGFVVDFGAIKDLDPIADGKYDAAIAAATFGYSKSGQPKVDVQWKILDEGEFFDRVIFDTMSFHPKALWRTKATLIAIGLPEDFSGELTREDLLGARATITIGMEQSSGLNPDTQEPYPARPRVKNVQRLGSGVSIDSLLS